MLQHSKPIVTVDGDDDVFTDAVEEFIFSDTCSSIDSEHSTSVTTSSSVSNLNNTNLNTISNLPEQPPEPPSFPSASGLRRRRVFHQQSFKEFRFKNSSDAVLPDTKLLYNLKDNKRLPKGPNEAELNTLLIKEVDPNSLRSLADDEQFVAVDSDNSGSVSGFKLTRMLVKVIWFKVSLLVAVVTFPVWLTHASYMFVTDPFAGMARARRHVTRRVLRLLRCCLSDVKKIVYKLVRRNKSVGRMCVKIGWGLMFSVFIGLVLVVLLVFAFVVSGVVMKCVVEAPVSRIARLNFDYTRDAPVAFVPVMSCSESVCLECDEKIELGSVGLSRVILPDRKLQATVSLTLPESGYNRNLGNFQVRVDFLSSNGKSLASTAQPCTIRFKSWPIRLLMTVFKLAPLITGYLSESQTVDIKFNRYTEREIPTSCVRVVIEPRAEFAKGGGVPEIYTASLKLESQLPLLKRILWSWKATVFVWTSIAIFKLLLVFVLLCCAPWLRLRAGAPLNSTGSR